MNRMIKACAVLTAVSVCSSAQAEDYWTADAVQSANGTYRSAQPEQWYGGFGTREFVFADGE